MDRKSQVVIGVDIGGTNIKIAMVEPRQQQLLESVQFKTRARRGPETIVANLVHSIDELRRQGEESGYSLAGVGVGCAGLIALDSGVVLTSPNLPGWDDFPLGRMLREKLKIPVFIENDVNCICYGEYLFGAGSDLGDFLCLAPGTGVGGGLLIDGEIWPGHGYSAGEVGHMTIQPEGEKCFCGNSGCLETLASATWLVWRAKKRLGQGAESSLRRELERPEGLDAECIYREAMAGDNLARELFHLAGTSLAIAIANVVHLLGIQNFLIAGGLANGWEAFRGPLIKELENRLTLIPPAEVRIVIAQLGADAGPLGGAYLAAKALGLR